MTPSAPPHCFANALDELHDLVVQKTGTCDFGADDYLPGLSVLLQSMDYDPHFTDHGKQYAWDTVVGVLEARLRAIKSMAENPAFDESLITSPVIITGMPRTGTTALHKLLAVDQRFQGLQAWLTDAPMPRPPTLEWTKHDAFHRTAAKLAARAKDAPGKRVAHDMAADEVDECCLILRQGFVSNLWCVGWPAATYDAWWQCQSEAAAYRHYYRCLQLIGCREPDKRWLLKNPGHIDNLHLLFATFPDAKVIITHRDPAKAVPSLVSLLMQSHAKVEVRRYQERAHIMLARETAKWANAMRKAEAVAQRYSDQVLHVAHSEFHEAPERVIGRVYDFIGMDLTPDAQAQMAVRTKAKPELQHGQHRYDIADLGMTEAEVRLQFGDYIQRYDLLETIK